MTEADKTAWKDIIMYQAAVWEKCPPEALAKMEQIDRDAYGKWQDETIKSCDKNGDGLLDREEFRDFLDRD